MKEKLFLPLNATKSTGTNTTSPTERPNKSIELGKWIKRFFGISPQGDSNLVLNQQGDWFPLSIKVTRDELITLIQSNKIEKNTQYTILDAQSSNPNCLVTSVILTGLDDNKISVTGHRIMLTPDYENVPIWNEFLTPSINDKVIFGGRVWKNLNGNVGAPDSINGGITDLNSEWELQPYVEGEDYTYRAYICKYDYVNDLIVEQQNNGLTCWFNKVLYQAIGSNLMDITDWGQDTVTIFNDVKSVLFVNNWNLEQCQNVSSFLIASNDVEILMDVNTVVDKPQTQLADLPAIRNNKNKAIACIHNNESIQDIPASVEAYTWVTDDESGYILVDFDNNPQPAGDLVIGCICPKGVSLVEVIFSQDGNLTPAVNLDLTIATDHIAAYSFITSDFQNICQKSDATSYKTTEYNRELILTLGDAINSGKLWIAYKYV